MFGEQQIYFWLLGVPGMPSPGSQGWVRSRLVTSFCCELARAHDDTWRAMCCAFGGWMAFHGCSEPRPPWSKTAVASVTISHPFWFGGLGLRVETSAPTEHTCRHSVFQVLQGQIEESEKKRASLESQVGLTGALCHFWVDFGSTKHINSPSLSFSQVISKNLHGTS